METTFCQQILWAVSLMAAIIKLMCFVFIVHQILQDRNLLIVWIGLNLYCQFSLQNSNIIIGDFNLPNIDRDKLKNGLSTTDALCVDFCLVSETWT